MGAEIAFLTWTFIPVQTQPLEAVDELFECFLCISLLVGIFYSENENPPLFAGKKPIEKRGSRGTNVGGSRRARSKSDSDLVHIQDTLRLR